ncbi:hypothetical protein [Lichenibacterium ramalinae]|uniref:DUF680 domain-containing protein n=1 Tax=Lichenibacterium ramalinae TaxID=2316527 RepID=A0A4Q2RD68_9HYPH|nr:hypothetical protein [Lichenibacterium ramalinae]RYB05187.1 hypothetical protein D3272_09485 [Lichenibacterium ramalinae]
MRSVIAVVLTLSAISGGAFAQNAAPAEVHTGTLPQPVGTTRTQQPAGVTITGDEQRKSGNTTPGTRCQSASAEMTNGTVETCAK